MSNIRLRFAKGEEVKYISHLDLLRTFQRALRRAGIPIAYSKGFNPHPIISFGQPLPVGTTSETEYMDIELLTKMESTILIKQLNEALPKGLQVLEAAETIDGKENSLSKVSLAEYEVSVDLAKNACDCLGEQLKQFMASDEVLVEKQDKKGSRQINIRPNINELKLKHQNGNRIILYMLLSTGSVANLKPELLLQALEIYLKDFKIEGAAIHRTKFFATRNGKILTPMEMTSCGS